MVRMRRDRGFNFGRTEEYFYQPKQPSWRREKIDDGIGYPNLDNAKEFDNYKNVPEVTLLWDECNIGGSVNGGLGFLQWVSFDFQVRKPRCRPSQPPPKPTENKKIWYSPLPDRDSGIWLWGVKEGEDYEQGQWRGIGSYRAGWAEQKNEVIVHYFIERQQGDPILWESSQTLRTFFRMNGYWYLNFRFTPRPGFNEVDYVRELYEDGAEIEFGAEGLFDPSTTITLQEEKTETFRVMRGNNIPSAFGYLSVFSGSRTDLNNAIELSANQGLVRFANTAFSSKEDLITGSYDSKDFPKTVNGRFPSNFTVFETQRDIFGTWHRARAKNARIFTNYVIKQFIPLGYSQPPDGLPPKKRKCCMGCCNTNQYADVTRLLRLILRRIGHSSFPITVPNSINKAIFASNLPRRLESIAEFIDWEFQQLDTNIGQFPIDIEIDDTDLTREGDQKRNLRIHNLSECLAEMFMLSFKNSITVDLLVDIALKGMMSSSQIEQLGIKNNYDINAIIDYMGFSTREDVVKMPIPFNAGRSKDATDFNQPSTLDVIVKEFSGEDRLQKKLELFTLASEIIKSLHFKTFDPKKNRARQIFNGIKDAYTFYNQFKVPNEEELERYIKEVIKEGRRGNQSNR